MATSSATAPKGLELAQKLAELFQRQGFQENYVNGAFDDYLSIGMGKTPLAFIYESQMLAQALKGERRPAGPRWC